MTPETRIKKKFKKMFVVDDHLVIDPSSYVVSISQRYSSGFPDTLFIRQGKIGFIEFKAYGKDLRPLQKAVARKLVSAGAHYIIVTETKDGQLYQVEFNAQEKNNQSVKGEYHFFSPDGSTNYKN